MICIYSSKFRRFVIIDVMSNGLTATKTKSVDEILGIKQDYDRRLGKLNWHDALKQDKLKAELEHQALLEDPFWIKPTRYIPHKKHAFNPKHNYLNKKNKHNVIYRTN